MSQQPKDAPAKEASAKPEDLDGPSETAIADYLCRHPDFFVRNPDVLALMASPDRWTGDGVVDMQSYLLDRHRVEIDDLRNCAQEVIENSRSNMSTQTRTHAAVLAVLNASSMDRLIRVVAEDWPLLLDVDLVTVGYEPAASRLPLLVSANIGQLRAGTVDALLGPDEDVLLVRDMKDDGAIFGSGAGIVRSAALARLRPNQTISTGLVAFGSRGPTFTPGQGTELIGFLARILDSSFRRLIEAA
jgi:uncharacterized protein YigA (DUF484 family)